MTDIRFYHMERHALEQTLPPLLTKALENGHRVIVKAQDEVEVEKLNEYLWTWNQNSFLPHGSQKDGNVSEHPVFLTADDSNPNGADVLILTQGAQSPDIGAYKLCCEMLDGKDKTSVEGARTRWKIYKDAGYDVTYWQQGEKGWEKKSA
ncbi:MAG: DNA polymerase III subunit chi [Alphaproteobacteria bacterium]